MIDNLGIYTMVKWRSTRNSWLILTTQFERQFGQWVGSEHIVRQVYSDRHYQRIPSTNNLL
jgi:hypothetical protein